jgi:hypothetical protein
MDLIRCFQIFTNIFNKYYGKYVYKMFLYKYKVIIPELLLYMYQEISKIIFWIK